LEYYYENDVLVNFETDLVSIPNQNNKEKNSVKKEKVCEALQARAPCSKNAEAFLN